MYLTDDTLRLPIDDTKRLLVLGMQVHLDPKTGYASTPDLATQNLPLLLPQLDRAVNKSLGDAAVYTLLQPDQLSPQVQGLLASTGPELRLDRLPAIAGELKADDVVWPQVITYYEKQVFDAPHVQMMPKIGSPDESTAVWRKTSRLELLVGVRLSIADGRLGRVIWKKDLTASDIIEVESDLDWTDASPPGAQAKVKDEHEVTEKLRHFRETLLTRVVQALVSEMLPRYEYR